MRRNITVSLDEGFVARMDAERGDVPRSRWLERGGSFQGNPGPVAGRSPVLVDNPHLDPELREKALAQLDAAGESAPSVQDVLRARIAEIEDKPMFSEPVVELTPEQKELEDRAREAAGEDPVWRKRYDEDDPRAWAE